jgi:hypothetical protein
MTCLRSWLLLVLALPTENATARMRFWRALKAMGCAVLRDGVYLLPSGEERSLVISELADEIVAAGGAATVIETVSRDRAQDELFVALFDRSGPYAEFGQELSAARKSLSRLSVTEANRLLRRLLREYEALRSIDYFAGVASAGTAAAWADFVAEANMLLSPDEPQAANSGILRLALENYQGRTWATRRHLWVDRVACAWLIRRFIDPTAKFLWLEKPSACPKKTLGFDFDGATFPHVGERVSFEVLLTSFGLEQDRGLVRIGELVHTLDVGGHAVPEAGGFEATMAGARQRCPDDDALLDEMSGVLDSLYVFFSGPGTRGRDR